MNTAPEHKPALRPEQGRRLARASRAGFTLIEALIATALLGFSLVVMFGFHAQAVRSNMDARKMTDCTYLSQAKMERLLSLPWTGTSRPADLEDTMGVDTTSSTDPWAWLEHPSSGTKPPPVNAANSTDITYGHAIYFITWDVEDMDSDATWTRIRVRCVYRDEAFNTWHGTTISSYRFRDS